MSKKPVGIRAKKNAAKNKQVRKAQHYLENKERYSLLNSENKKKREARNLNKFLQSIIDQKPSK